MTAKEAHVHFHGLLEGPRKARNSKRPRMKYSVTCPAFLMIPWISSTAREEISGARKRRTGSTIRELFSEENVPVDIQKIKASHKITGPQYLMKFLFILPLPFYKMSCREGPCARLLRLPRFWNFTIT